MVQNGEGRQPDGNEWAVLADAPRDDADQTDSSAEEGGTSAWRLAADQVIQDARSDPRSGSEAAEEPGRATEPDPPDQPDQPDQPEQAEKSHPGETDPLASEDAEPPESEASGRRVLPRLGGRRGGLSKAERRRLDRIAEQVAALSETVQTSATEQERVIAELRGAIEAADDRSSTELATKATELGDSIAETRQEAQSASSELRGQVESNKRAAEQAGAELGSKIAVFADQTTSDVVRQIDELRGTVRTASETDRAELDRFGADLDTRIKDARAEIDATIAGHGEQIGQIDDNVAKILGRLTDEAAALRNRVQTAESAAAGARSDIQDLALRVERGLVDASDRIASVAGGLEQTLGERIAAAQRAVSEDNIALGREIEELRSAVGTAAAEFAAEGEGEELESGMGGLAAKVRGIDSGFSTVLDRLDSILEEGGKGKPAAALKEVPTGSIALNSATFEELRSIGLSVTQTARLIAYRDTHGGFTDLEQLREVRGLSSDDLRRLAERATL